MGNGCCKLFDQIQFSKRAVPSVLLVYWFGIMEWQLNIVCVLISCRLKC